MYHNEAKSLRPPPLIEGEVQGLAFFNIKLPDKDHQEFIFWN